VSEPGADTGGETLLERALRHQRVWLLAALIVATALAWAWIVPMAIDMYGPMTGASAWMMTDDWDLAHLLLLFAMWVVMMAGMMLPSAAPMLLFYARAVHSRAAASPQSPSLVYAFAAGYLAVWTAFSLAATVLQRVLAEALILSPMMEIDSLPVVAALLVTAGVYQFTPLKTACLTACRTPLSFVVRHWRPGRRGAFAMGWRHGLYCLGCCWALMLLLFAGGVMNLAVIGVLAVVVLLEKVALFGRWTAWIVGVALVGGGVTMLYGG
jgi:predicted metal-binding membrane protein